MVSQGVMGAKVKEKSWGKICVKPLAKRWALKKGYARVFIGIDV
jgi:hypothetical protein